MRLKNNGKRNIKLFDGERYRSLGYVLIELNIIHVVDKETRFNVPEEWKKVERTAKGIIVELLS